MPGLRANDRIVLPALLAAGAVFYLAPWLPLALLALAAVLWLTWLRLDLALVLVPAFAPLFMLPKHLGSVEFAPSEVFLWVNVAVCAAYLVLRRDLSRDALLASPFRWPLLLFLLGAILSTALAAEHRLAIRYFREDTLGPVLYFAMVLLVIRRWEQWRLLFGGVLLAGMLASAVALVQAFTGSGMTAVPGSALLRAPGPYGSPDNLGLLLDRVLPVWFAFFPGAASIRRRAIWPLPGIIYVAALAVSFSRAAWIAVAASWLAMIAVRFRQFALPAAAVAILALALLVAEGPRLAHAFRSNQTNTVQLRVDIWESSLEMARDHPLFGVGPDNFSHYYAPRAQAYSPCAGLGYMKPGASGEPCQSHPHDEFLDFWLSTGLAGLAAFVWLEVVFWRSVWKLRALLREPGVDVLLLGAAGAMLASVAHGLVDNSYFLMDLAVLFWLFCGYVSWRRTEA